MNIAIISPRVLLRKGLCALLEPLKDFEVLLDVDGPAEALKLPSFARTHVVLIDALDPVEGFETLLQIQQHSPDTLAVFLIDRADPELELRAIRAGCQGCLSRRSGPTHLEEALRVVRQGEVWVSQQASSQLVKKLVQRGGQKENEIEELTRREWETLALVAAGNRNKEIANRLCVSENTVKAHLYAIYRKLHVSTRMGAALFFFQQSSQPGGITRLMHTNDPAEKSVCKGDRPRRKLLTGR